MFVICHNIRSAHNVGSVFRTADGVGVKKIYLCGYTPCPPHPMISKVALGAEENIPWEKCSRVSAVIGKLRKEKFKIAAIEQSSRSKVYTAFKLLKGDVCLVLGNEVRGLSQALLDKCDEVLEIPMRGKKESLNVSVAFGIVAYHLAMSNVNANGQFWRQ